MFNRFLDFLKNKSIFLLKKINFIGHKIYLLLTPIINLFKKIGLTRALNKIKIFLIKIFHFLRAFIKSWFKNLIWWEKISVIVLFLILITSSSILIYQRYNKNLILKPLPGGEYIEGIVGQPRYINPVLCQTNKPDSIIASLVFSGLTRFNLKGELEPEIAEKWESSQDNKIFTFHLKKNVYWHDNTKLKADDLIFTISLIKDPDYQGTLKKVWQEVKIEKIDDFTIRFILNNSSVNFLENTTIGILPKHILKDIPVKNINLHTFNLNPIGTGPYKFERADFNVLGGCRSLILRRNDIYYKKKPYLEKIVFNFYENEEALFEAYREKEILALESIKAEDLSRLKRWRNFNLYHAALPEYLALFLNNKKEFLNNKEIRQALSYATNKEEIIKKVLNNEAHIVNTPILPNFLGYDKNISGYNFNPSKTKEIFQKQGFKLNKDKFLEKNNKVLSFNLVILKSPINQKIAELIKKEWGDLGIKIEIKSADLSTLQRDYIRPRNYDILLYGESLGRDVDIFPYWHSSEISDPGLNLSLYDNKEADRLLEEARQSLDNNVRQQKYTELQKIIIEDSPAIFLYQPNYIFGASNKIKGIELKNIVTSADRFNGIFNWFINYQKKYKNKK